METPRTVSAGRYSRATLSTPITRLLDNPGLRDTLAINSTTMKKADGVTAAAEAIVDLI